MTKLTDHEVVLLDQYLISNNFTEFSEAHFFNALADIVPRRRLEQLAGDEHVYEHIESESYKNYINQLLKENK